MLPPFSRFAQSVLPESAFEVLAAAKQLKSSGKDVIELEIGDSPFPATPAAALSAIEAIQAGRDHYVASAGIPEFRRAAADFLNATYGLSLGPENILAGHGGKPFEQFFCEAFLNPGDAVLVFSPYFPTYPPNIARRGARMVVSQLHQERMFRPSLDDVARFLRDDPAPKAVFLNSPHNPTGGMVTRDDLEGIASLIRGRPVMLFSDEPYDFMAWQGPHHAPLTLPGMLDQCVAAYTFSKSYSMSGWRLGFAAARADVVDKLALLLNTTLSCVPPFVQWAGIAALREDAAERDRRMGVFRELVRTLVAGLNAIPGVHCLEPAGTFYAFASFRWHCDRHGITSRGLAMYLLEGADDELGVACLGGESFGPGGEGFIRFSCAEPRHRIEQATRFISQALTRVERLERYLRSHPHYRCEKTQA